MLTINKAILGSGGKSAALGRFGFIAPLKTSVVLDRGTGAASYTRATVATVKDFEGNIRNVLSGEVRFEGQRRVRNYVREDVTLWPKAASGTGVLPVVTAGQTDPNGTATAYRVQLNRGAGTTAGDYSFLQDGPGTGVSLGCSSLWIKSNTGSSQVVSLRIATGNAMNITATTSWQRLSPPVNNVVYMDIGTQGNLATSAAVDVLVWHPQLESKDNQSNQNPSEYVSVGAAKLNELVDTELLSAWTSSGTLGEVINGQLGNAVAWDLTDDAGAAYEYKAKVLTVPNDSTTRYFGIRVKKTSGGTAPTIGFYFSLNGGGTPVTKNYRLNTDLGTAPYGAAFESVVDRGTYWECVGQVTNNTTGNTTLNLQIYPAAAAYGGVADSVAATGTQTVAAPWVSLSNAGYFPVGNVYPYHGACVDGVKYFDYENGNTVSNNVVTEAVGRSLDGYSVALLDGTTGYFSTPDSTALRITGKISLRAQVRAEDFTPSATQALIAKSGNRYMLRINTTGGLIFTWYDGSVQTSHSSTLPFPASDKTMLWARTDFEPDNGAGGRTTRFYWSADYNPDTLIGTWTLFDTITDAGVTQIGGHDTGALTVGYSASGPILTGTIRRAQVFNNDTGAKVADFNPREGWTENAVTGSGDFTTNWTLTNLTKTLNAIVAPDGTTTGVKLAATATAACNSVCTMTGVGSGQEHCYTIYAHESGTSSCSFFNLYNATAGSSIVSGQLDYATGAFSYGTGSSGVTVTKVANGWWKIDMVGVCPLGANINIYAAFTGGVRNAGDFAYVWHPQLRRLSVASQRTTSQYLPTTTAALRGWISSTGEQWTINGAATVLQRQAEGYLPEGASTNLVLQSSNFGTTWAAVGTPTRSAAAKYCGDIALDLIGDDSAAAAEGYTQTITFTADAVKSVSLVVAQDTSTSSLVRVQDTTAVAERIIAVITWSSGTPVVTMTTGTQERSPEALGNGCYRIFLASSSITAANVNVLSVYPACTAAFAVANTGNIYIGGVQAENATVASSHIPTAAATVTRNLDNETYPGAGNISATEGTIYAEVYFNGPTGVAEVVAELGDGTANERITLSRSAAGNMTLDVVDGGVSQASLNLGAAANGALHKVAFRYKANDFAGSLNGAAVVTDTAGTLPTVTTIYTGTQQGTTTPALSPLKNMRVGQTALTDAMLIAAAR